MKLGGMLPFLLILRTHNHLRKQFEHSQTTKPGTLHLKQLADKQANSAGKVLLKNYSMSS